MNCGECMRGAGASRRRPGSSDRPALRPTALAGLASARRGSRARGAAVARRSADSSETFAARPAASPSSTSSPISANIASTASTPSGSRSASRIFSASVGRGALVAVEQLLVELLPGPAPDDLDVDVAVGVEARELDHRAGEVDDAHRLAHVEHEHLGAAAAIAAARRPAGVDRLRGRGAPTSEPERMISWTASGIVMK